jgi:hypothetical protein
LRSTRGDGRHWDLTVTHDQLGSPSIPASMEFARRPLALAPEPLALVALPIHRAYPFDLPVLPVIAEAEACAEKLARYRRTPLGRDLYDLFRFAGRPIDEPLVRRLWVLKVWGDVVDDGRGHGPLDPAVLVVVALAGMWLVTWSKTVHYRSPDAGGVLLILAITVPLAWRRQRPGMVLVLSGSALLAYDAANCPSGRSIEDARELLIALSV